MLDIYICEDNAKQLAFLADIVMDYVKNLPAALVLASHSPAEILSKYKNADNPALFILDISLKTEINGLELARRIREQGKKATIVFVTIYPELMQLTFQYKIEALDFIIKSDNIKNRLKECIDVAIKRQSKTAKTLQITADDEILFFDMDEITHIETTGTRHKLRLYTSTRAVEFNAELKAVEEKLDERFIRCHKSCIINRDKIALINKKDNTVTMANGSICPVSRGRKGMLTPVS